MAMPSDRLPFQLTFLQYKNREIPVTEFVPAGRADELQAVQVTENLDLQVLFTSDNPEVRFYMDGLDLLPDPEVDANGLAYLPPADTPYDLFMAKGEFYPLIPGFYRVIVTAGEERWHALVQVLPKQLSVTQWEIMKDELEQELRGLAQDLIRKNMGLGLPEMESLPVEQLFRFMVIRNHFPSVLAALNDMLKKVNYKIRKEYHLLPIERAKAVDEVTVRYRLTHPEDRETLKSPVRVTEYDLPENRWVKKIVQVVSGYLDEIMAALEAYRQAVQREIAELQVYQYQESTRAVIREKHRVLEGVQSFWDTSQKMKHSLQVIKTAPWYDLISWKPYEPIPHVLMYDPRYRALYQLYRDLKAETFEVDLDTSYAYQWKRTDKLYEMWGFLKTCRTLMQELGFKAVSGWLFDASFAGKKLLIPTLPAGTVIRLAKDDVSLHLVYDAVIPAESGQTRLQTAPLYTSGYHNRPDCRLDIYKGDVYVGTLIVDFKYRPRWKLWDEGKRHVKRPHAMNTLLSYRSGCQSPYLFGDHIPNSLRKRLQPVTEVWAAYPTDPRADDTEYDKDYYLRLVKLTPGERNAHVAEQLQEAITNILEQFEEIVE